jgi:hypothetical protein
MNLQLAVATALPPAAVAPPSIDPVAAMHVSGRFGIPVKAVTDLVCLSVEELRERDRFIAMSNQMEAADFPRYPLGSAKVCCFHTRPLESYTEFLDVFDSRRLVTSEPEGGIRKHRTYLRYVEMLRDGLEPPYIHVFEDEGGKLVSTNRRRTLASQELGRRITGWHDVPNHETGNPLKYGDVLAAYEAAV